jgi:hypothetical protein
MSTVCLALETWGAENCHRHARSIICGDGADERRGVLEHVGYYVDIDEQDNVEKDREIINTIRTTQAPSLGTITSVGLHSNTSLKSTSPAFHARTSSSP